MLTKSFYIRNAITDAREAIKLARLAEARGELIDIEEEKRSTASEYSRNRDEYTTIYNAISEL